MLISLAAAVHAAAKDAQHQPALLRLQNISSSELMAPSSKTICGLLARLTARYRYRLNNDKWIIKDGWFSNPGPMTLRLDKRHRRCVVGGR